MLQHIGKSAKVSNHCRYTLINAHLLCDWWLNGDRDDSSEYAGIESRGKLRWLVWSEDEGHSVTGMHELASAHLVQHVERHLLGTHS